MLDIREFSVNHTGGLPVLGDQIRCIKYCVRMSVKLKNHSIYTYSLTGKTVFYVVKNVYDVPRLHKTRVMLPNIPFCNIKHLGTATT